MEINDSSEILQLVSFTIGREEFGVDIVNVQEIIRMISVTKIPGSPAFLEGVMNLRGRVIPVVNLRIKMNLEKTEFDRDTRVIVVDLKGRTTGFIVDAVNEVLRIPESITEKAGDITSGIDQEYITSIAKLEDRLLILLDLEKVLQYDDREKMEEVL